MKRLLVSGYKPHELGIFSENHEGIKYIKIALEKQLNLLLEEGLEWVIISGQQGVELWCAEIVLELQKKFPQLQLAVITPFLEQEKSWKEEKQQHYHSILSKANFVSSITNKPYEGPWQFRAKNKFLLENSDGLLVIYDEENEGSAKYIKETAIKNEKYGYKVLIINGYDLQTIIEEEQYKLTEDW